MNMALSSVEQGGVSRIVNALTVDVEDYFQVQALKDAIDPATWDRWPARVVENTGRVLALLNAANIQGTFFVLGWVAERFPEIVPQPSPAQKRSLGCSQHLAARARARCFPPRVRAIDP